MSKKNNKKSNNINKNIEDKLLKSDIVIEKSNKKLIIGLIITSILLIIVNMVYLFKPEKECPVCEKAEIIEVEVEPKYQYINYDGFKFKMPLTWDFVKDSNKYEITNEEENLFINLYSIDISYDVFISSDFQKSYLEEVQTSSDTIINKSKEYIKDDINYYLFEGTYNKYNYQIIAVGNDKKVVLVNVQYVNKVAYKDLKDSVLDFSLSAFKN